MSMSMSMSMSTFCSKTSFPTHKFRCRCRCRCLCQFFAPKLLFQLIRFGHDVYVKMLLNMQLIAVLQRKSLIAVAITDGALTPSGCSSNSPRLRESVLHPARVGPTKASKCNFLGSGMAGGYYNYYHTLPCSGLAGDNVGLITASRGRDLNCGILYQVQPPCNRKRYLGALNKLTVRTVLLDRQECPHWRS